LSRAIVENINCPGKQQGPRVVLALDAIDGTAPQQQEMLLRKLCERADALVLGLTPPGEIDAASAWSLPLPTQLHRLGEVGFDAYDLITPFLEPYTHAFGGGSAIERRTSFLLDSIVAVRRGGAFEHRLQGHAALDAATARERTDLRLQLLFGARSYSTMRARYESMHEGAAVLRKELEHQRETLTRRNVEVDDASCAIKHRARWRALLGRLFFQT
jgi:hypothetical protein